MKKKEYFIFIISSIVIVFIWVLYQFWWLPQFKARELSLRGYDNPHGCAVAFNYYWCEVKQRCLRASEEDCAIEAGVKSALALKYRKPVEEIFIKIKKQSARFAEGVIWVGRQEGEGNRWMAAKPQDKWEIVYAGLEPINCEKITKAYELPPSVLQGFCD